MRFLVQQSNSKAFSLSHILSYSVDLLYQNGTPGSHKVCDIFGGVRKHLYKFIQRFKWMLSIAIFLFLAELYICRDICMFFAIYNFHFQDVVTSLRDKLCLSADEHFSLVLEHVKSLKRNKLTLLDPEETLARVSIEIYILQCAVCFEYDIFICEFHCWFGLQCTDLKAFITRMFFLLLFSSTCNKMIAFLWK